MQTALHHPTWITHRIVRSSYRDLATVAPVRIKDPQGNTAQARQALGAALDDPRGRARLAPAGALADVPGRYTSRAPAPKTVATKSNSRPTTPPTTGAPSGAQPHRHRDPSGRKPVLEHRRRLPQAPRPLQPEVPGQTRIPRGRPEPPQGPRTPERGPPHQVRPRGRPLSQPIRHPHRPDALASDHPALNGRRQRPAREPTLVHHPSPASRQPGEPETALRRPRQPLHLHRVRRTGNAANPANPPQHPPLAQDGSLSPQQNCRHLHPRVPNRLRPHPEPGLHPTTPAFTPTTRPAT